MSGLHEEGVVQLKEISEIELSRRALGDEFYGVSSLLAKAREIQEFLMTPQYGRPVELKELTYGQTLELARKTLGKLEPKLNALKAKSKYIEDERQKLFAQIDALKDLREIKLLLQYLRSTEEFYVAVGRTAEEKALELCKSARDALSRRVLVAVFGKGKVRIVVLICRARDQPKILPILYKYEVELIELPPVVGVPRKALKSLEKRLVELQKREAGLKKSIRKLAGAKASDINCLVELLEIQKERLECGRIFGYTDATIVLEGWIPAKKMKELETVLGATTHGQYVVRTYEPRPAEVEIVPTQLENPQGIKDFEYVTKMYGLPKYDEVDPTPLLTITFAMFFAICLSDAGYGIILGLFMASNFWFAKVFPRELKRMMVLCAIFTIFAGLMMGGWFGDALAGIHPFFEARWANPIENPIPLLKLALFIGILHLLLAFGVAGALKDVFRRDWRSLMFVRVSRGLIIIGFFGLSFCVLGMSMASFGIDFTFPKMDLFDAFNPFSPAAPIVSTFRIFLYLGLVIGVIGAMLTRKGGLERIGGSVNVVYGIVGMVADVVSYARLMALGLATGVIAFLVNYVVKFAYGSMFPSELSVLSAILAVPLLIVLGLLFVAGHGFNIFISSLGGFIHTMRLHFAEFFGKFYEAGGLGFTPFKAKRTFTKLKGVSRW
ncbi:MAG: V-type ATP synthase subunit I [Candidatus Hodarchaeaceae archaeon]|nr:V-type ATP synthase subunit I [Candidatus Hodarchaeaceae archaeon]